MRPVFVIFTLVNLFLTGHCGFGFLLHEPLPLPGEFSIKGQVVDGHSGNPLAFATVEIPDGARGAVSDIDGFFEVSDRHPILALQVSHVGYQTQIVDLQPPQKHILVNLQRKPIDLAVANNYVGENPAHRIIRNVTLNRNDNNPEKSGRFSYRSYNKMVFSPRNESSSTAGQCNQDEKITGDTPQPQHYMLMVETVSERFFKNGLKDNEKVLASRISGATAPYLAFLATKHQAFSLYANHVEISDEKYLSPLAPGSTSRYLFILEKTSFEGSDSVFVISYWPKKNRNFNGLEGVLTINSNGWAVQTLTAEQAEKKGSSPFSIRQFYKMVDAKRWFPVQLDVDLKVFKLPFGQDFGVSAKGMTYISNIDLEPDFSKHLFSNFSKEISKENPIINDGFWEKIRPFPLTPKERETYRVLESLGREKNFDGLFRFAETLGAGKLRLSMVDFYIDKLVSHTRLDGVRLGVGGVTNHRFSERLRFKGMIAYGLKSNQWRMGYSADVLLNKKNHHWLGLTYWHNTRERGEALSLFKPKFLSLEMIRGFLVPDLDLVKSYQFWTGFSALGQQVQVKLFGGTEKVVAIDHIYAEHQKSPLQPPIYRFFETGIMLRFAFGERHIATPTRTFVDTEGSPVAFLSITKGFDNVLQGGHKYLRTEGRLDFDYRIIGAGVQNWSLQAGFLFGVNVPWSKLFTAPTAPRGLWPGPLSAFATMDYNEFVSDAHIMLFFRHDFERHLTGGSSLWPRISVVSNLGIGSLRSSNIGGRPDFGSFQKGFFEAGVVLSDFFAIGAPWLGVQLMHRFGAHSLPTLNENFSARLFVFMPM